MNTRFLLCGAFAFAASVSQAAFLVTIDNVHQSTFLPGGPTDLIFTGTITKDELGDGNASTFIAFPGLPGDIDFLAGTMNSSAYFAWTLDPNPAPFVGELFRITVLPTSQLGLHNSNSLGAGGLSGVNFTYKGVTGATYDSGYLPMSVNIVPVPEPATLFALGLGALALRRRKKARA